MSQLEGRTLGHYHLLEELGRGGMATVYKAYQPSLDRHVAVKILAPFLANQRDFFERFRREATAVARLSHPNILNVYDFGQEGDLAYIVMEYVVGGNLAGRLGSAKDLAFASVIIAQMASALDYAHRRGIIHRDIKPANILMAEDDWAILSDFGIAKIVESTLALTQTGMGIGTPEYMSPEQGQGLAIDQRTDIYSLGVVLYEI
ncbi:MAG: serine/threonine protein kinase, partial [Chloroflexi bacterium]|nr:serine/threonine protein kinase [Chloroflexota bacterium]